MKRSECDRKENRTALRMWMRRNGWVIFNPLTALIAVHIAAAVLFALLGWEDPA